MTVTPSLETLPGFRRQIRITPGPGRVVAAVNDDFHEMVVTLAHDGRAITGFASQTLRAPWEVCPGAQVVAARTFVGRSLARALAPTEKPINCTHLYDLAVLAAVHALDGAPLVYDVRVTDPAGGRVSAEIRRNGVARWQWQLRADILVAPAEVAEVPLRDMRHWIAGLDATAAEAARMLQWCCIMARARQVAVVNNDSVAHMALQCYAFGGEAKAELHRHTHNRIDFSALGQMPVARTAEAAL